LTPIEVLSETAQKISKPSSLGTRLSVGAPYEEFRRLAQAFNTMMDRIQKVVDAQRRFVADAAHEIQTPLTVLKGNLEVAFRKPRKAAEYREVLVGNLREVERLINLSRSLITLAKLAGNEDVPQMRPLALEPVVDALVDELRPSAEDRRVRLRLESRPVPPILGDETQIKRLLINLLSNALRHTPAGGAVTVSLDRAGEAVRLAVCDDGDGIAAQHLPHLFERFYRVDSARSRDAGGTGLGLAIVKEIVEVHHARIEVESDVGKGSRFIVSFEVQALDPIHGSSTRQTS
jgi:heavy metal sensor kinase